MTYLIILLLYAWAGYLFATIMIENQLREDPDFLNSFSNQLTHPLSAKYAEGLLMLVFAITWLPFSLKVYLIGPILKKCNLSLTSK